MAEPTVTRGHGLLESFLASKRARMAERLIPASYRTGRILDVGCGSYPYFLSRVMFAAKVGVDKVIPASGQLDAPIDPSIHLMSFDIAQSDTLPLHDQTVDVVTMLAVFEHIRKDRLVTLLNEVERVLRPGGIFVMTTPSGWTGPILSVLTVLGMVSKVEIDEHQDSYSAKAIRGIIAQTRLAPMAAEYGYFELGMNIWARISKPVAAPAEKWAQTPAATPART